MTALIVSDYVFIEFNGSYYNAFNYNKAYYDFFSQFEYVNLYGTIKKGNEEDIANLHTVDDYYFKVLNANGSRLVSKILEVDKIFNAIRSVDFVYFKMFYVNSVLGIIINRLFFKKPSIQLLVGNPSLAFLDRSDIISNYVIRRVISKFILLLVKRLQSLTNLTGYVSNNLRQIYGLKLKSDRTYVENEFMFAESSYFEGAKSQSCIEFLFVGRLVTLKRVEMMIEAFEEIHKAYPNTVFNIVGDGPLRNELEKLASSTTASNCIHFKGWLKGDEILKIYKSSNIMLLCSTSEGLPLVLLEAMANNVLVIVNNVGGISEIVTNELGFLIDDISKEKIISAATYFFNNPKEMLNKTAQAFAFAKKQELTQKISNFENRVLSVLK